jgi:hypothetical protein
MIEIKDNQIWFIHEFKEGEKQKPSFSAELLSAYICPVCHNILKAFFKGNFSYDLNTYKPHGIDYQFGYVPGGTYMEIQKHSCYTIAETVKECKDWEIVKKSRGVADSLETLSQELGKHVTPSDFFISKAMQGKTKYLRIVPDMLGNDNPLLMYHRDKIIGVSVDDNIDSWYDRNQEIGEIFAGLITEEGKIATNTDIKVDNNIDVDKDVDNVNVLEEQVISKLGTKKVTIQKGQVSLFAF